MQTGKITALYVRFSYDDGIDAESGSIEHQKSLLRSYAESNGFTDLSYYADDGYTGTNFNRPDFQRMLGDIHKGLVSTVIVKDMSRLGRNYLMVGQYVEIEFPKHNVRFIAISDNVDSAKGMNDLLPIHNLMNEWYSRDISKKVRAMIRQKGNSGQSIASKLPYGYYNTPEDKQTWLIDESAANVVRRIFDLYLNQSFGMYQIARILKAEGIPRPTYHRRMAKGIKVEADDLCVWSASVVRDILQHREYIGDTVNFRTEITSYKNKKVIHNSDDKLKIFPNTHPAIIDKETFQKVQDKISKEIRHTRNVHSYLFADYLYCMDCHSRMHGRQCYLKGGRTLSAYECSTYRKSKGCCFHGVPEMYLQAEVLAKIQNVLAFAKSNSAEFRQNISKALEKQSDGSKAVIQEELDKAQARTAEIDTYIQGGVSSFIILHQNIARPSFLILQSYNLQTFGLCYMKLVRSVQKTKKSRLNYEIIRFLYSFGVSASSILCEKRFPKLGTTGKTFETEHNQGKKKERAWAEVRRISDELCRENNLSVIKNPEQSKGKSHWEWDMSRHIMESKAEICHRSGRKGER